MPRIIWAFIKDKLILPYLDADLKYYDPGVEKRDEASDHITIDATNAIKQYGAGVAMAMYNLDESIRRSGERH